MHLAVKRLKSMLDLRCQKTFESDTVFRILQIKGKYPTYKFIMNDGKLFYLRIVPGYANHRLPLGIHVNLKPKGEPDWYTSEFYVKTEADEDFIFYKATSFEADDDGFKLYGSLNNQLYGLDGEYPYLQQYVDCVRDQMIPLFEYWIQHSSVGYGLKD